MSNHWYYQHFDMSNRLLESMPSILDINKYVQTVIPIDLVTMCSNWSHSAHLIMPRVQYAPVSRFPFVAKNQTQIVARLTQKAGAVLQVLQVMKSSMPVCIEMAWRDNLSTVMLTNPSLYTSTGLHCRQIWMYYWLYSYNSPQSIKRVYIWCIYDCWYPLQSQHAFKVFSQLFLLITKSDPFTTDLDVFVVINARFFGFGLHCNDAATNGSVGA